MPLVPRANPLGIPTAPLPGVRVPTDVPAAAFGSPAQPDLGPLQHQLDTYVQRERDKADSTALLDADNQLAQLQTDLHTKATSLKGRDAQGASQQVQSDWQVGVSQIESQLHTDQQREAFAHRVGDRWQTLYGAVESHAAAEADQYVTETATNSLQLHLQHATEFYKDPNAIAGAVADTKDVLAGYALHQGWSKETLDAKTAEAVTGIHANVIDRMIANHQDLDAAAYLTDHRDEMTGDKLIQAENLVSRGSVVGAAQRSADGIVKSAATLTAALDKTSLILDPQVRDGAEERVRRHFEDMNNAEHDARLQAEFQAGQIVRKQGYDAVPERLLAQLLPEQLDRLKYQDTRNRQGVDDVETVGQLNNMAGLHPDQFTGLDLSTFRAQLSKATYNKLVSRQLTMRQAEGRTATTTRNRQGKDLKKLNETAGYYKGLGLEVPADTKASINALRDSIGIPRDGAPIRTPAVPGQPLPKAGAPVPAKAAPAKPATSPGFLPKLTPIPPHDDDLAFRPSVPPAWLEHAQTDPDYAAYLDIMGVRG